MPKRTRMRVRRNGQSLNPIFTAHATRIFPTDGLKPDQIRTNPFEGRNGELICHNCGRLGSTHAYGPPAGPFNCRAYEGETILETTFEAHVFIAMPGRELLQEWRDRMKQAGKL